MGHTKKKYLLIAKTISGIKQKITDLFYEQSRSIATE